MGIATLIIGESGSGKSTSLRNLKPEETYIIALLHKPLPFKNKYKQTQNMEDGTKIPGNIFMTQNYKNIIKCIKYINEERKEIKNIIIDDFQYMMVNEFMERAAETGYKKFTEIADHVRSVVHAFDYSREDLHLFILSHSELKEDGKVKIKTIGNLLDREIHIDGLFT